jgi:hypothetical protein
MSGTTPCGQPQSPGVPGDLTITTMVVIMRPLLTCCASSLRTPTSRFLPLPRTRAARTIPDRRGKDFVSHGTSQASLGHPRHTETRGHNWSTTRR